MPLTVGNTVALDAAALVRVSRAEAAIDDVIGGPDYQCSR